MDVAETERSSPEDSKQGLSRCYFSRALEAPAINASDMYPALDGTVVMVMSILPRAAMQRNSLYCIFSAGPRSGF